MYYRDLLMNILKVEYEIVRDIDKNKMKIFKFVDYEGNALKGLIIDNKKASKMEAYNFFL